MGNDEVTTNGRDIFVECNLRCTKQRLEVFRALSSTRSHPTAEELHQMVQSTSPGTSLATVYNTLEALCKAGLCRKIATVEGGARYDAELRDHLHVVTHDGRVVDVPEGLGQELLAHLPRHLIQKIETTLGVEIGHINVALVATPQPPRSPLSD